MRDDHALTQYLLYITDPGFEMAMLYSSILSKPETVERRADSKIHRIDFTSKGGDIELSVSENPLWFYSLKAKDPMSGRMTETWSVSAPEPVKAVPAQIQNLVKGIHFEDSKLDLYRLMLFP